MLLRKKELPIITHHWLQNINDSRYNKIWKSVHLRIEMCWSIRLHGAQIEEAWGCAGQLLVACFTVTLMTNMLCGELISWNLQNGVTSRRFSLLGSTWHLLQVWQGSRRHSAWRRLEAWQEQVPVQWTGTSASVSGKHDSGSSFIWETRLKTCVWCPFSIQVFRGTPRPTQCG